MNKKKTRINPYLIILLKNMIAYEFSEMEKELNNLEIAQFIYKEAALKEYKHTCFSSPKSSRDHTAYGRAERIRKYLLTPIDFDFSNELLNQCVQELSKFKKFGSWDDFYKEYCVTDGARIAERNFMNMPYSLLSSEIKTRIRVSVKKDLINMHHNRLKIHASMFQKIIYNDDEYTIRSANSNEIAEIEWLADQIYPCPINRSNVKRKWHEKNPYIFYIAKDDLGVWANINLLPIDKFLYQDLKYGNRYEDTINKSDLYSPEQKHEVKYIYVEGLACTKNKILLMFVSRFKEMIQSLAETKNVDLIICAIGGSKEGDKIMQKFGFERTGWAVDHRNDDKKYPFFEITWKMLEQNLNNNGFLRKYFNDEKRLTPID